MENIIFFSAHVLFVSVFKTTCTWHICIESRVEGFMHSPFVYYSFNWSDWLTGPITQRVDISRYDIELVF